VITPPEEDFIKTHAYVPEHVPGYGAAISQGEPFLLEEFLCYRARGVLIFVGYPLGQSFDESRMKKVLQRAVLRFRPAQVSLLAPAISFQEAIPKQVDTYYKLDLSSLFVPQKVRNRIHRAGRELKVGISREFREEHRQIVDQFLDSHALDEEIQAVFTRIPAYLASVSSALLFEARNPEGKLAAFDIAEFGAKDYAFYMFNFRSRRDYVPGASDFLLQAIITEAKQQGKKTINLGLGINEKVAFFKKKWGGLPFLEHRFFLYRPSPSSFFDFLLRGLFPS